MSRLSHAISRVLAVGLVVSLVLLITGAIITLARPELAPSHELSLRDMPRAILSFEPTGLFGLGLLVLLVTPVARVIALFLAFSRRREWLFVGLSLIVFVALSLSVVLGLRS